MKTMKYFRSRTANGAFIKLAERIYHHPEFTVAPRGEQTREMLAVNVTITDPRQRYVTHPYRKFSLKYGIGEWLWYRRASNRLDEITYYSRFWERVSDDGATLNSAYGYRIFGKHPKIETDQWEYVKRELSRDPNSRRAVITILAAFDLHDTRDLPCTVYMQFFIRDERLYLSVNMRSNDLILGFANDVFAFTLFQEQMLCELRELYPNLRMGEYYHFAGSLHIYERNFQMVENILKEPTLSSDLSLPRMQNLNEIELLQAVEKSIRLGVSKNTTKLSDPFCIECVKILQS